MWQKLHLPVFYIIMLLNNIVLFNNQMSLIIVATTCDRITKEYRCLI